MTEGGPREPRQPLLAELRWLIRLRFLAVVTLAAAAVAHGSWQSWTTLHVRVLALAAFILLYNLAFWLLARRGRVHVAAVGWGQVLLDIVCIALLVLWTGGVESPLLWLYLLHMVFASLMLPPRGLAAYLAATSSIVTVLSGLWLTDQWPAGGHGAFVAGVWILVLVLISYLADHVTAALRAEQVKLRRQHHLTRGILHTAADGIITIDTEGTIQAVNPAAERIFGYEGRALIGQNIRILMPEPYYSEHDGYLREYLRTGKASIIGYGREVMARRHDGSTFPLDIAVSEIVDGDLHLFTGIVRDITARKQAEQRLQELNAALVRQRQGMIQHEKMVAAGQLAAGVVHEISNPLACMDSVLQLIERNPSRLQPDTVKVLRQQVDRIRRTMGEMTAFVHPNETMREHVSVNRLVDNALAMVRFDHRIRDVEVERAFADDAGDIHVMPNAIQQVLINMILNALDAVEGKQRPRLVLRTASEDDFVRIEVEDNGAGIERSSLEQIFDPFFTTKPPGRGTGLGLSISYSLVQRHGGRIEVWSRAQEGTRFSVHLPRREPERDPAEPASA